MIRVRQIKIPLGKEDRLKGEIAKKLHISCQNILSFTILKKSLDARRKTDIHYVYEVDVEVLKEDRVLKNSLSKDVLLSPKEEYQFVEMGSLTSS